MTDSIGTDALIDSTVATGDPQAAQAAYQQALEAENNGDRWQAIEHYQQAYDANPADREICFRLAYSLDLVGEEQQAIELYEQCCAETPAKINALINLAVLYEDNGQYAQAEKCLVQVVETDPNHARANLFLKDIQATRHMYYDEDQARVREKHNSLLETPVTDFELSVRARNCLKKMNIRSLGDLLRTTEAELLAYKNFGETSLQEIKSMLAQKGLSLGQTADDHQAAVRSEVFNQLAGSEAEQALNRPVADLNLSVRARKALSLLNIQSVADLVSRTEAELLGIKNFGATSLTEIKERLHDQGLSLRVLED